MFFRYFCENKLVMFRFCDKKTGCKKPGTMSEADCTWIDTKDFPKRSTNCDDDDDKLKEEDNDNETLDDDGDEKTIYLDYNATTPTAPEVRAAVSAAFEHGWANPSSKHSFGKAAGTFLKKARRQVARSINANVDDLFFCSGATEADNWAIKSALAHFEAERKSYGCGEDDGQNKIDPHIPHIIASSVEHEAVQNPLLSFARRYKAKVTFLDPVDGQVSPLDVVAAITSTTCLVSVMLAHNETGCLQPLPEIVASIRKYLKAHSSHGRIFVHTDAAQAVGKIPVDVAALGVDFLSIAGHKFYGPRIGVLYVRNPAPFCRLEGDAEEKRFTPVVPVFFGGGQQRGYRPGTEDTYSIAGLGAACELISLHLPKYSAHYLEMRIRLQRGLEAAFNSEEPRVIFNGVFLGADGTENPRLPNTLNVTFRPPSSSTEIINGFEILKRSRVACSMGSACHALSNAPSKVLLIFGAAPGDAIGAVRFSVGRETTPEEIDIVVRRLRATYETLYGIS